MTSQQKMPGTETQEEQRCEGCHVWGQPHIVEKPAWWYESLDESASTLNDSIIQESHGQPLAISEESLVVSQMAREEEEEQREVNEVSSSLGRPDQVWRHCVIAIASLPLRHRLQPHIDMAPMAPLVSTTSFHDFPSQTSSFIIIPHAASSCNC
ncbi:hypothetical protein CLCR_10953 [Cladophialophora carrionii]|uniref:Uncharacterized protein n=1 Tax=Cladophialophora carrionii TaxID=86049 RepID=A0A1C1CZS1_9EURO|nr:hypothetical protein CLCR_10953 [Cladophialophora carrionii]